MSAPQAPDPYQSAAAQSGLNRETAVAQTGLNAMNQYTPDGSLEYSQNGTWADGTPRFSSTTRLSPGGQELYDLNQQTQRNVGQIGVDQSARIGSILSSPLNLNVGAMPTGPDANASRYNLPGAQQLNTTQVQSRYAPDPMMVSRQEIGSNEELQEQLFDAGRSRLDPMLAQRRGTLDASLADKGIAVGSDAYSRSMTENAQNENDIYNQLFLQGQGQAFDQANTRASNTFNQDLSRTGQFFNQGAQKAAQDFGQDLSSNNQYFNQNLAGRQQYFTEASSDAANRQAQDQAIFNRQQQSYGNQMQGRQQTIDEILQQRNQPINEIAALLSGSQVSRPTWTSTPQTNIANTDLMSMINNNYRAESQQYAGMLSGLGPMSGNIASAGVTRYSDIRLKTDIRSVGKLDNGLTVYAYRYKSGGPVEIGLMAQDVEKVNPDAVGISDGFKTVNYALATEAA